MTNVMISVDGRDKLYIENGDLIAVIGARDGRADSLCASIAYAELRQIIVEQSEDKAKYIACMAGEPSPASKYALKRFGVEMPPLYEEVERMYGAKNMKVALVGHNTLRHAADGIIPAQVLEIVDRHPLGGMKTKQIVRVLIEPVGATCAIVRRLFRDCGVEPGVKTSALLCVGIITATAGFTTKTCRNSDILAANEMADAVGIDINELIESLEEFRPALQFITREEEELYAQNQLQKYNKHVWR
jgi:manganese-dependent inorganic pyrophosphatase